MNIPETIPEMRVRYERQIADLQGQIERLTLDLEMERGARERAEKQAADNLLAFNLVTGLIDSLSKQATTP